MSGAAMTSMPSTSGSFTVGNTSITASDCWFSATLAPAYTSFELMNWEELTTNLGPVDDLMIILPLGMRSRMVPTMSGGVFSRSSSDVNFRISRSYCTFLFSTDFFSSSILRYSSFKRTLRSSSCFTLSSKYLEKSLSGTSPVNSTPDPSAILISYIVNFLGIYA